MRALKREEAGYLNVQRGMSRHIDVSDGYRFLLHALQTGLFLEFEFDAERPSAWVVSLSERRAQIQTESRRPAAQERSVEVGLVERVRFPGLRTPAEAFDRFGGEDVDIGPGFELFEHALRGSRGTARDDRVVAQHVPVAAQLGDVPVPFQGDADTTGQHEKGPFGHEILRAPILPKRG